MAELHDCSIVQSTSVEGLTSTTNNIGPLFLEILPKTENLEQLPGGGEVAFTVAAEDFNDLTFTSGLVSEEDREGIQSITLSDTGTPGELDNTVLVRVDFFESYNVNGDTTVKVDIGGFARAVDTRPVVLALVQDITEQTGSNEVEPYGLDPTYYAGSKVATVTVTPASGVSQVPSNGSTDWKSVFTETQFAVSNLYDIIDQVKYYKTNVKIGEPTKIADIVVQVDQTLLNSATGADPQLLPGGTDKTGVVGFLFVSPDNQTNNYLQQDITGRNDAAIWMVNQNINNADASEVVNYNSHQLRIPGGGLDDVVLVDTTGEHDTIIQSEEDGQRTCSVNSGSNTYGTQIAISQSITNNRNFVCTSYHREWWFTYPSDGGDQSIVNNNDLYYYSDVHIDSQLVYANNALFLGGVLAAQAEYHTPSLTINRVTTSMDVQNTSNNGYIIIPANGTNQDQDAKIITIFGEEGAKFTVKLVHTGTFERSTGERTAEDLTSGFDRAVDFVDIDPDPLDASTGEITITSSSSYQIKFPTVSQFTGDGHREFDLLIEAGSNTTILSSAANTESTSEGIDNSGNGNTLTLRVRQNPNVSVGITAVINSLGGAGDLTHSVLVDGGQGDNSGVTLYQNTDSTLNPDIGAYAETTFEFRIRRTSHPDWVPYDTSSASRYQYISGTPDFGQALTNNNFNNQATHNSLYNTGCSTYNNGFFTSGGYPMYSCSTSGIPDGAGFTNDYTGSGTPMVQFTEVNTYLGWAADGSLPTGSDAVTGQTYQDFFTITGTMRILDWPDQNVNYQINLDYFVTDFLNV